MSTATWQAKVQAKQAEGEAKIPLEWRLPASLLATADPLSPECVLSVPRECGLLTERELAITETADATALLAQLAAREYSAVEVARAFCKRAAIAQQLTQCLTETFFEQALARAEELDTHLATTGRVVGPLHGLPVSLKDMFEVAGVASTLGYVAFLDRPVAAANTPLVDVLVAAGAVLYVKTNVPQTLMTADSHNNVFGRVLNPHRRTLTAGGSTGGEAALVALRGSLLGVATDIGGSIRIPAHCCGLVGFKPSVGRVPSTGLMSPGPAGYLSGISGVVGPIAHSVRDANLFMKTVCDVRPDDFDDTALGIPWTLEGPSGTDDRGDKLRIGLFTAHPDLPLHPNIARNLHRAAEKLAAAGHEIVDITEQLPSMEDANATACGLFSLDADRTSLSHLAVAGEPSIPSSNLVIERRGSTPDPTLRDLFRLTARKAEITARTRRVFVDSKLDLILAPAYQSCAPVHDTYSHLC
ncbi:putative general amidase [Aspergillus homomorphus CBS 101889]|uniref:Amidase signature enzyme n=1 Tax=Aspergillus homomorphus (strain CBS 101889) TaxID=1450537 RepID=A0A395I224_ASPHC|nr:amidase signature enzyme [Aspergillus homomorphus CBS 101889]RAL14110.1 amidase signature enzyme [Aspergillus homomorphus CBS 101889]